MTCSPRSRLQGLLLFPRAGQSGNQEGRKGRELLKYILLSRFPDSRNMERCQDFNTLFRRGPFRDFSPVARKSMGPSAFRPSCASRAPCGQPNTHKDRNMSKNRSFPRTGKAQDYPSAMRPDSNPRLTKCAAAWVLLGAGRRMCHDINASGGAWPAIVGSPVQRIR